jgi:hypothetical protein
MSSVMWGIITASKMGIGQETIIKMYTYLPPPLSGMAQRAMAAKDASDTLLDALGRQQQQLQRAAWRSEKRLYLLEKRLSVPARERRRAIACLPGEQGSLAHHRVLSCWLSSSCGRAAGRRGGF